MVEPVVDPETGEVLVEAGQKIDRRLAGRSESAGVQRVVVEGRDGVPVRVIGNGQPGPGQKTLTADDIVATVTYLIGLMQGVGEIDDIDHLGNRRLKSVGELLQNQFRIGLSRMERVVRERMTIQDVDIITPQALDQHPPRGRGHQGVFRLVPAVPVHGPDQPPGGADPQAAAVGPGARRTVPGAGRYGSAGRAPLPLRPHVPHRDAGGPQHRPHRQPLARMPG